MNSRLYTDYHYKSGDKVILRDNTYAIKKNYISKGSVAGGEDSDTAGEEEETATLHKMNRASTKSLDLNEIEEVKNDEEPKIPKEVPTDPRIEKFKQITAPLFDKIEKICDLAPENSN
jgi:hypothetical protein